MWFCTMAETASNAGSCKEATAVAEVIESVLNAICGEASPRESVGAWPAAEVAPHSTASLTANMTAPGASQERSKTCAASVHRHGDRSWLMLCAVKLRELEKQFLCQSTHFVHCITFEILAYFPGNCWVNLIQVFHKKIRRTWSQNLPLRPQKQ